ncbi:short-chain dehydrogenase [Thalassospira sp. MCCC 1A02491]|nr:short-chain dehydrogenase [Thalassospira sp. MCCC 1A02491]
MHMTDNTIFITGGTSGIGRGLAEAFHKLGNKVIIAGRRKGLLDEITKANPGMDALELDINDIASIDAAAKQLINKYPNLNVLINNAGIMPFDDVSGPVDDTVSQQILTTNVLGPVRMTSALVKHLKTQQRATIINNSSVLAFVPLAGNAVYSASKAAIHSYSMSLRFMLRDTSVSVQEIAPPWVNTDLIKKSDDPRAMDITSFIEQTMLGLATETPEVVVEAAAAFRANVGPDEHEFVHNFNAALIAEPIPV